MKVNCIYNQTFYERNNSNNKTLLTPGLNLAFRLSFIIKEKPNQYQNPGWSPRPLSSEWPLASPYRNPTSIQNFSYYIQPIQSPNFYPPPHLEIRQRWVWRYTLLIPGRQRHVGLKFQVRWRLPRENLSETRERDRERGRERTNKRE